jgi:YrbI family 3-deoxy-D-manno-octulosonate 8-phosphate phosphatase
MSSAALAIIPARGGSKGILRKNVRVLAGKPLIAHAVEHAREAKSVSRVIVSTDDSEIASVAKQYGADIVWRPAEISGDTAPSESALLHVLDHLQEIEGYEPDLIVLLQCTSPLTLPEDIDRTVQSLLDEGADSAVAVTPFHYFLWRRDAKGDSIGINHDKQVRELRQQQEPQFIETGAVYAMRAEGFKEARHRFFGKTAMYVMPRERWLEIDDPFDLRIAELLMDDKQQRQVMEALPDPIAAIVLDFDGVLSNNKVIVSQDGREAVICDRSDGWGLAQVQRLGIPIVVLSSEANPIVQARCDKLGIPCVHGVGDKLPVLMEWLRERNLEMSKVVYVGNDVNDLACLQAVGGGIAVADAHPLAKGAARAVLSRPGGGGAIRELCDLIARTEGVS